MTQLYYVKVMYEHDLYTRHIKVAQPLPGAPHEPISHKEEIINSLITIMQKVVHFYNHERHERHKKKRAPKRLQRKGLAAKIAALAE